MRRTRWSNEDYQVIPFSTDGGDYTPLLKAAQYVRDVPGMSMELGVRAGGGSKAIIDGLRGTNKTHIALDPYGSIDYEYTNDVIIEEAYPNRIRDVTIPALYNLCASSSVDFLYFQMTDTQFFKRFEDGVPIYRGKEYIVNTYALVYFDGPHSLKSVMAETEFFEPRTEKGAAFVYDDVETYYDHSQIKRYLESKGWQQFFKSDAKAVYHKLKEV